MRRTLALSTAAILGIACGADPSRDRGRDEPDAGADGEPRRGGGWDANSGNWNGNMGSWAAVAGIGGNPPWAPNGTGPGTLTNEAITGLRWTAPLATTPCGQLTASVDRVRFLSSTRTDDGVIGPDVELERAGVRTRLAMGERVVFHGEAVDGTLASIQVTIRLRRVDTLSQESAPDHEWPVFELELCEHARPDRGFTHLGYVSWSPMVQLPETATGSFSFPAGLVQPVTTLPRAEYRDNPNVPLAVAKQTGALMFKFAFYAALPVALADEPELALTTSRGATLDNDQVLVRGAIALGNGGWVTLPGDAGQHPFLTFFTRTGTPASMFAIARGDGSGPAEIKNPAAWGRDTVFALQLTPPELVPSAANSLDDVQAYVPGAMVAGDTWAHGPSELGHGPSPTRHGYYLNNSSNNNRLVFFTQLRASTARARWGGLVDGQVASQQQLDLLMRQPGGGPTMLVAAESPPPGGKPPFESPHLGPMPEDSPVYQVATNLDAGLDADLDAPVDADLTDAAELDASPDASPDAATDASTDALDLDAPLPADADVTDAIAPPDAGVPADAPLVPADATFHLDDGPVPLDGGVPDALVPPDGEVPLDAPLPMCKAPGNMCDALPPA
ncbi:MAG TPA: hypothetical protein VHE35_32555 [Kofleriaceae bacterium]|nr:hypothetical protein [Kofleriaceae bacterium]